MDKEYLKKELKQLILVECDKADEFVVEDIVDEDQLFGDSANLDLDSLDALQISMAVQREYNVRIEGVKDGRIAFASINALADYILARQS
jgi:acyl carrier protein